jgi:hypothetical protein
MRATELLATRVLDADGRDLGPVRDARVRRAEDGSLTVVGLVVGDGPFAHAAHAWGFAEGRAQGPWLLRALTARATRAARYVPADDVASWRAPIRLRVRANELDPLRGDARR